MLTLGIDLASQAQSTATCVIDWKDGLGIASRPVVGRSDADILNEANRCDIIGVDAPFGWPLPFIRLTSQRGSVEALPEWTTERRDSLRYRLTDYRVREVLGRWPLSVSTDLIAVPAMRCAGLLERLGVVDYAGGGRVWEVYPAVALATWGLPSRDYKGTGDGELSRRNTLVRLERECSWLRLSDDVKTACARSDHAFDALVSSMVARAAAMGLTARPLGTEIERARVEGWIAIPTQDSLGKMARSE